MSNTICENSIPVGLQMIANSIIDQAEKSMVNRWLKEYQAHSLRSARRRQVLNAISEGYDTLQEIIASTGIPQTSVIRIIERFVASKRITSIRTKNPNNRIELRYETV